MRTVAARIAAVLDDKDVEDFQRVAGKILAALGPPEDLAKRQTRSKGDHDAPSFLIQPAHGPPC